MGEAFTLRSTNRVFDNLALGQENETMFLQQKGCKKVTRQEFDQSY